MDGDFSNKHLGDQRNELARICNTPLSALSISMPEDVIVCLLPSLKILDKHLVVPRFNSAFLCILAAECRNNSGVFGPCANAISN